MNSIVITSLTKTNFLALLNEFVSTRLSEVETLTKATRRAMEIIEDKATSEALVRGWTLSIEEPPTVAEILAMPLPQQHLPFNAAKYAQLALTLQCCEHIEKRYCDLYLFLQGDFNALDLEDQDDRQKIAFAIDTMCVLSAGPDSMGYLVNATVEEIAATVISQMQTFASKKVGDC